jgi:thiosulfate/3-mercaptopyruvate sulfurtransferase
MLRVCACYLLLAACLAFVIEAGDAKPAKTAPAAPPVEPPAPKEFPRAEALLSTAALADATHQGAANLVLIDARSRAAFESGHLPGAFKIESDTLQDPQRPPYFMPASEALKKIFAGAGIHAASRVVVYDEDDARLAARVWFTLHACGHGRAAILDGGVSKWRSENRPLVEGRGTPPAQPGDFEPLPAPRGVCTFAELPQFRTRVHTLGTLPPTTLLDARSLPEYMGEDARAKAGGHIPGAANIEWSALLTGKEGQRVWRAPPEIHAILRMSGVEPGQKIAVYDQAGGRSAHLYFTLWLMGFPSVFNYVAGWREYGNREDVEIEK